MVCINQNDEYSLYILWRNIFNEVAFIKAMQFEFASNTKKKKFKIQFFKKGK